MTAGWLLSPLAIFTAGVVGVLPAAADTLSDRIGAERIVRQRGIDLGIVRSQQRRETFAREQQIMREAHRYPAPTIDRQVEIPRMQPGCQIRIDGNSAIGRSCR